MLLVLATACTDTAPQTKRPAASATPTTTTTTTTTTSSPTADPSVSVVPAALRQYYEQRLDWQPCRKSLTCARVRVPLDYAKPRGRSIEVALLKYPATGPGRSLGPLVYNPGGPGISSADYVENAPTLFGRRVMQRYDAVGLDPRGVGESTPVDCLGDKQLNVFLSSDPDPDTRAETRRADRQIRALGRGCLRRSGRLAAHVSTEEVARDLDIARAAMGRPKLTYFGASYGTAIGYTYAELFPERVGRMVLDGAQDPRSTTLDVNLRQAKGFEVALRSYAADCVDSSQCPLGSDLDAGVRRVQSLLRRLDRQPLPAGDGRELTLGNAFYGLVYPLYSEQLWPVLTSALRKALDGDGSLLLLLADEYLHRNADGTFRDSSFEAFYAVSCIDHDDAIPTSKQGRYRKRFERASPTFGRTLLYATSSCEHWPVHTGRGPMRVRARGAAPIIVIGTTRDPATPLVWAKALASQLDSGVLVTRDGDGHTGYRQGSSCVDDVVESYLLSGTAPPKDVTCR